jgi:hypothetical protein
MNTAIKIDPSFDHSVPVLDRGLMSLVITDIKKGFTDLNYRGIDTDYEEGVHSTEYYILINKVLELQLVMDIEVHVEYSGSTGHGYTSPREKQFEHGIILTGFDLLMDGELVELTEFQRKTIKHFLLKHII